MNFRHERPREQLNSLAPSTTHEAHESMVSGNGVKRGRVFVLAAVVLTTVVLIVMQWSWSLSDAFSNKVYNRFCVEEADSLFDETNDTVRQTRVDVGLDIWQPDAAMKQLHKYNYLLNQDVQPITLDPNNASSITQWWQAAAMISWYLKSPPRYQCSRLRWYGNWGVCQDDTYPVKKPCLVYSFGIAFDFRFDDAIGKSGCDVRSFDPSMERSDYQRLKNVRFYATGLGTLNTNSYRPAMGKYVTTPQLWKVRTLTAIRRELGHSDRVLDVLKLDIEAWEWSVLDNIMETNLHKYIRHLLVEYHLFPGGIVPRHDYLLAFQIHTRLRQLGFLEYYSNPHSEFFRTGGYNQQGEVFYVNSRFNLTALEMSDSADNAA